MKTTALQAEVFHGNLTLLELMKTYIRVLLALALAFAGLEAAAQVTETYSFTNLNRVISDGNWSGLSDVHSLTSSVARLGSVRVKLKVAGEYNGDLYCYLRHTSSSATNFCVLLNRVGRSATNSYGYPDAGLDVQFDDLAANGNIHTYQSVSNPPPGVPLQGPWQPDGRRADPGTVLDTTPVQTTLSSFNGVDASGTWTLFVADVDKGGTNMLVSWEMDVTGAVVPALTWAAPADIVYGTALGPAQLNASAGSVAGTFAYEPPAGAILNAGTHTLQAVFTPADSVTYLATTSSVSINVLQKGLTITANNSGKTYNGLPFSGGNGVSYSGFVNRETPSVLGGTLTYGGSSQGAINAGAYVITPGGLTSSNYAITFANGTLTVNPAALAVTANAASKTYNGLPFSGGNGVSYAGFVNGDTPSVLGGALTYGGSSQGAINAGAYVITPGGLTSSNYAITFANGTLTVNPAALAVTAIAASKTYNGLPFSGGNGVSYSGFVNGETLTVLGGALTYGGSSQGAINVGAYVITPGGLTSANYTITFANGTLTISKALSSGIVSASQNPSKPGDPVTLSLTLTAVAPGGGTPTGFVQFRVDGLAAGSLAALSGDVATYTTSTLSLGTHTVAAEYAGDGNFLGTTNSLTPNLLINTQPVAGTVTIGRYGTNDVKVAISTLLSHASDSDGDPITFVGVSATSTNLGTVTLAGDWIIYTPPADSTNLDSFTYTISDGRGTPVSGTVVVEFVADTVPSPNLIIVDQGNGSYLIQFSGIPGVRYRIEYSEDLNAPNWLTLGSAIADAVGFFQYLDTPPAGSPKRYYRSVYP